MSNVVFVGLVIVTLGLVLFAALSRNVVYSAFALLAALGGVAGLYLFLSADFIAAVQVLVYVGGVMILFLFALMVTTGIEIPSGTNPLRRGLLAAVVIVPFLGLSAFFIQTMAQTSPFVTADRIPSYSPLTAALGRTLIDKYMASFEVLSVLLLVGLLGAVAIVRRTIQPSSAEQSDGTDRVLENSQSSEGDIL